MEHRCRKSVYLAKLQGIEVQVVLRKKLRSIVDSLVRFNEKVSECSSDDLAKVIDEQTTRTYSNLALETGQSSEMTIKITSGKKTYTYVFLTNANRRYLLNYGFLFSSKKVEPDQFYLNSVAEDSFQVTKRTDVSLIDLRYTPTIFFSVFLDKNLDKPWNNSLTAGLGFNTETPVVAFGYNGTFHHNIGVSAGICFYNQNRLNSRYTEGQILKESLEDDQLYDKHFRPNFFIAINFRLGENPHKTKEATATAPATVSTQ